MGTEPEGKKKVKVSRSIKWLVVVALVAILSMSLLVTVNTQEIYETKETYYETEPYTTPETYYETEPYTTTEAYYETEPYVENVPIDYRVTQSSYSNYVIFPPAYAWVTIKNTDTKSGYFRVTFNIVTSGGATATRYASEYISIGEEKTVSVSTNDIINRFTYSIDPPTKEVTKYRDVQKVREVTKYHDVQKERTVTSWRDVPKERTVLKVRTVQKPIYEIILGYIST